MSEQLDLFDKPRQSVIERCRAKYGFAGCVRIYADDMTTVIRAEDCRHWCPLLNERIE